MFPRINLTSALILLSLFMAATHLSSTWAIPFPNYDESAEGDKGNGADLPSLYELILQRELMDKMIDSEQQRPHHFVVRKSERYPSLRLRFGRRADPAMAPIGPPTPIEQHN